MVYFKKDSAPPAGQNFQRPRGEAAHHSADAHIDGDNQQDAENTPNKVGYGG